MNAVFGTDEPPTPCRRVVAGRLSFDFEAGAVRYLRVDGVEVLRGIAFLVRDPSWGTLQALLDDVVVSEADGRARLSWRARVDGFAWTARIEADGGGVLFTAEGHATADLTVNRLGFVVLHPVDGFAGAKVTVEHADGSREIAVMPRAIAPHQPAFDIAALTHIVAGLTVRVAMGGDVWEMEDQRNWTDASFKTYARPLSRPRPFTLRDGEAVSQTILVSISGTAAATDRPERHGAGTMPAIALTADPEHLPLLPAAIEALRPRLLHLRLDAAQPAARHQAEDAAALGLPLLLDVVADSPDELAALAGVAATSVAVVARHGQVAPALLDAARAAFPTAAIGVAVRSHFTELNRDRPDPRAAVLVHMTSAIVHAADDRTVMESLDALPDVFASARALAPAASYRPGPCTIGQADGSPNPGGRVPTTRRDPRHGAMFAAAWAVGVLSAASRGGVASISFGTPAGDFSLLAADGTPTPLGRLTRDAAALAGRAVTASLDRIAWDGGSLRANLTPDPVILECGEQLGPYGVAWLGGT